MALSDLEYFVNFSFKKVFFHARQAQAIALGFLCTIAVVEFSTLLWFYRRSFLPI